jgi:hypothetical protein
MSCDSGARQTPGLLSGWPRAMKSQRRAITLIGGLVLSGALFSHSSLAATFSYEPILGNGDDIAMRGEIQRGDYQRLLTFIRADPQRFKGRTIVLASAGGDLLEAIKIGTLFKSTYKSVFVNQDIGVCASACFFVYVASVNRIALPSSLGIHRPYFAPAYFGHLSVAESEKQYGALLGRVRSYLQDREVPQYLIEKMFSLASSEVYWLTVEDLDAIGPRPSWYDQFLVDRCRLNKELEQGYMREGEAFPLAGAAKANIAAAATCEYLFTATAADANLQKLLSAANAGKPRRKK